MKDVKWCFKIQNGLKLVEPNDNISEGYLEQSENALSKVKSLIDEKDFVWANSRIYYCAYYAVLSFLYKIGVKSENHDCSIKLIKFLFGKDFGLSGFKEDRISAQYYFKFSSMEAMRKNYFEAKKFFVEFKELINSVNEEKINFYRNKIMEEIQK